MHSWRKDPGSIAAEIKMTRMEHDGAFLLLEGVSDARFWHTRRHDNCELVIGGGKKSVVGAVDRLDIEAFPGVLGIVDDDYDSLLGKTLTSGNLVATDAHDLECLLCRSDALESVLAEFGVAQKIQAFTQKTRVDVRTGLLERALVFGRLRWAAARDGLDIDRKALRVPRFVDADTWAVDGDGLLHAVSAGGWPHGVGALERCIATLPPADPWRVAHGHDMIEILRIGLKRVLGRLPASKGHEDIARILRVGVSDDALRKTALHADIRTWERANAYLVLLK